MRDDETNGHPDDAGRPEEVARRAALLRIGAALALVPLGALTACGGAGETEGEGGAAGDGGAGGQGGQGGGTTTTTSAQGVAWASGGTASMSGDYPDPFTEPLGSSCALTCAATLGPCYAETIERKDISEGYPGLPTRLAFLVVNDACEPIAGAQVDVWHTRDTGVYSGDDTSATCHKNDPDAIASRFFRGVQTTDANGRVDFDTCYPGWYGGRCVHIHFTVRVGGQEYVTSQLYFPEELTAEIFAVHPDYVAFGQPDTTNSTDGIFDGEEQIFQTAKQKDGALLAWKTLVIRSSLADPLCG